MKNERSTLGECRFIETVSCRGYRFVADVTEVAGEGAANSAPGQVGVHLMAVAVLPFTPFTPNAEAEEYLGSARQSR